MVGSGYKPGYRRVVNLWLTLHVFIGALCALVIPTEIKEAATTVLLPAASIFVGLTFAWIANVQGILQTDEATMIGGLHQGGFVEWVYPFQLGVLVMLFVLAAWGLFALGLFEQNWQSCLTHLRQPNLVEQRFQIGTDAMFALVSKGKSDCSAYIATKTLLYALISLGVRTSWSLIGGTLSMIIVRASARQSQRK